MGERIWEKMCAFANYGFPESHSQSFAAIVYYSAWFKCHHPAVFCAALLRAQPMGFYSPQSLVADARRHGVEPPSPTPPADDDDGWDAKLDLLRREPVPLASFTFGVPAPAVIADLRRAGTTVLVTATTEDEARDAARCRGLGGNPARLLTPVVLGAVAYAERTAEALQARGLGERPD